MRTEQDVLNDFEKLGYKYQSSNNGNLIDFVDNNEKSIIKIDKKRKRYIKVDNIYYSEFVPISLQEHKLLNKLFQIWGWI